MESQVEFEVLTPVSDDVLIANVHHALSLGLSELRDYEYPWNGALRVVANGPSARRAELDGKTLAINGALGLFTKSGRVPTYWIACDPQELVADFLDNPPMSTTYLIASKCHPKVFERLKDRNVVVWHVHDEATWPLVRDRDPVARGVSVTICCFEVMARLGWRKFDTWGWDGCFMDGEAHAVPQGEIESNVTIECDEMSFKSTHSWGLESQDAIMALRGFPFPIHIHGMGMIGEILKTYLPTRITTDRN